jgi:hypothetical protein
MYGRCVSEKTLGTYERAGLIGKFDYLLATAA